MLKQKNTLKVSLLLLVACTFGCAKQNLSVDSIENPDKAELIQEIDSSLAKKFQGAVLVAQKDEVIFAKGYGLCDPRNKSSEPITINTTFEIGSITKQMTAAAIMQLCEKGKISVSDKLTKYFPDYKYGDEITIDLLLRMRSGIVDMVNAQDDFFPRSVCRQMEKDIYANRPLEKDIVLKYLYDVPLMSEPDKTYFYSNTNYYLLAKIIEQVSGKNYSEYMEKNIFKPADMTRTNTEFRGTETCGYDWKKRSYSIPKELGIGCGDVNSTVVDLFKWSKALRSGKIIRKKSYKKMLETNSYGYGLNYQNGEIFHSGVTCVFNSYLTYYPETKTTIIVLVNKPVSESNATSVSRNIYRILDKSGQKN